MSFTIFQKEKTPFQAIKTRRSKSRKIVIFLKGLSHGFWTEMAIFAAPFFFGKIGLENVFYAILQRKNAFLGYKNKKIEKSKNCHFSKGVNPWFQFKNGHFLTSFFQTIKAKEMSFTIFQNEKTPFQVIKTRRSKSRKITIFPKGLSHGFGTKMPFFSTSLFRQHRPGKFLLLYSRTKKRLSRLLKEEVQKVEKLPFFLKG